MFNIDSYFEIGSSHKVCQDYAFWKQFYVNQETYSLCVVSDGCSSAPNSEFGSQMLCKSMGKIFEDAIIAENLEAWNIIAEINKKIAQIINSLGSIGVDAQLLSFAATANILLYEHTTDILYIYLFGDGGYSLNSINGEKKFFRIEFANNAPYYPLYNGSFNYERQFGTKYGTWQERIAENKWSNGVTGLKYTFDKCVDFSKNYSSACVFTDGLFSYQDESNNSVDKFDSLFDYKSLIGEFISRKMMFLKNKAKQNAHYDDVAIAGLSILN